MTKALGMLVDLRKGQAAIDLARSMNLLNHALKIVSTKQQLCIPLTHVPSESESERLSQVLGSMGLEEREFIERRLVHRNLPGVLEGRLPAHLIALVPKSFDVVGQIAIIELSKELVPFSRMIGKAVLETSPSVRTVMAKAGVFSSDYRVRELRLIAGEDNPVTRYKEHGCVFELDVRAVFFSPRLSHERLRVASQVQSGERVVDMFAGVGPYSILIAKKQPKSMVHAVELNPSAFKFLESNVLANRVVSNVKPARGDVHDVIRSRLAHEVDRAIMNLPGKAVEFIDDACYGLRETGGVIHFYSFENAQNPERAASAKLQKAVEAYGRKVKSILSTRVVKEVAPYKFQVGVDALVG
jgi:tRNA (guanine37-N1)-methyltransferase